MTSPKSVNTLYVAGPMTGYPNYNYPAFNKVTASLAEVGYEVLNPVDSEALNPTPAPQQWDWYMRHALGMVLRADGIAVLPGWECSRGARLEVDVAHALGLPVKPWPLWITKYAVLRDAAWPIVEAGR